MIFFSQILLLIGPLFFAGLLLVFILKMRWFESLNVPVDLGMKCFDKRIFGENKTWRGVFILLLGTIVSGTFLTHIFSEAFSHFPFLARKNILFTFLILGISYIAGELFNSFIKRQFQISPGKVVKPPLRKIQRLVDLSDGIISSMLVGLIFFKFSFFLLLASGILGIVCHYLIEKMMVTLKLKST